MFGSGLRRHPNRMAHLCNMPGSLHKAAAAAVASPHEEIAHHARHYVAQSGMNMLLHEALSTGGHETWFLDRPSLGM